MARDPGRHGSKARLVAAACLMVGMAAAAGAADNDASATADELLKITEPLLTSIAEEEARNGPYSASLVELLTSLGLAYQENGEDVLALAVLDRALYLKRVNEGLFGMDQAALLERLIDSQLKIGRVDSAEDLRSKLLELARRNRQDERSATIFREAAEREVDRYETYLREGLPPTFTIGDPMAPQREAAAGVWRARRLYNEAIWALLTNPRENRAELAELEKELARTYYLEASGRSRWYRGVDDPLYGLGLMSHKRLVEYSDAMESPSAAVDYARALIELADWSLLFSRNGTAVKRYAEAYDLLIRERVSSASIEEFFPAATPVFLPAFAPPLDGVAYVRSSGYVDVDFQIGKYGQPRKVTIVAVTGDDAAAVSKQLAFAIGNGRFRPSPFNDGAEYRLRYSLADGSLTPRL
jgi:tetratricopeptide (TPR) repeat protein